MRDWITLREFMQSMDEYSKKEGVETKSLKKNALRQGAYRGSLDLVKRGESDERGMYGTWTMDFQQYLKNSRFMIKSGSVNVQLLTDLFDKKCKA